MMQRLADVIYRLSGTMIYVVWDPCTVRLNGGEVDRQRMKTAYMKQACSIVTHSYPYSIFYRASHILHDEELFSIFLDRISNYDIRQFFKNEKKKIFLEDVANVTNIADLTRFTTCHVTAEDSGDL